MPINDPLAFILQHTRLRATPHVPEISLHVADEAVALWQKTEEELETIGLPPPFWAFAWAGGQALARYVLDQADVVTGRRVLDLAAGSGLVGIAAAMAGAAQVRAVDVDSFAGHAITLNAKTNRVSVDVVIADILDQCGGEAFEVILVGDLFYQEDLARRAFAFLDDAATRGATVLIGDPGRAYLPTSRLVRRAEYHVPVTRDLEDRDIKRTAVWSLA